MVRPKVSQAVSKRQCIGTQLLASKDAGFFHLVVSCWSDAKAFLGWLQGMLVSQHGVSAEVFVAEALALRFWPLCQTAPLCTNRYFQSPYFALVQS